jgi:hypothetical protein
MNATLSALCVSRVCQSLKKIEHIDDEGVDEELFSDLIFEVFTAQLSNGVEVSRHDPLIGPSQGKQSISAVLRRSKCARAEAISTLRGTTGSATVISF